MYIFFGLPSRQIQRLQLVQNSAARLVTRTKKHEPISPVLKNLHWLPIQSRIQYKVLLLTYQCFHQFAPLYLIELLTPYKPQRMLRSSKKALVQVPHTVTESYAAAVLWNNLPEYLKNRNIPTYKQFRNSLKIHLLSML